MKRFIANFSESELVDNAQYTILGLSICAEGGMQSNDAKIEMKLLKPFLEKHPNSELVKTARYSILYDLEIIEGKNLNYWSEANRFINDFPESEEAERLVYEKEQMKLRLK